MATVIAQPRSEPRQELFRQLAKQIKDAGLLDRNPVTHFPRAIAVFAMLAVSIAIMAIADSFWIRVVVAAVFMGIAYAQIAFFGHDLGHQQIFRTAKANNMTGLAISFLLGIVRSWWVDKHNGHHANPNVVDVDPDTEVPFLAFSKEQAMKKRGLNRLLLPYQAPLFYHLICLEGFGLRQGGVLYARKHALKYGWIEMALFGAHIVLYLGAVFMFLPWRQGLVFILIHQMVFGFYMGMVFAPNHKGMEMLQEGNGLDLLINQVVTSRDIKGGWLTSFLYGGLNDQITHHLFPRMPCANLRKARRIVRDFCEAHGIECHETSFFGAQREIWRYLTEVGRSVRANKGEAA